MRRTVAKRLAKQAVGLATEEPKYITSPDGSIRHQPGSRQAIYHALKKAY